MQQAPPRRPSRVVFLPLVVAAVSAVLAAQMVARDPRFVFALLAASVLVVAPAIIGRGRMKRVLMSGDVQKVIGAWENTIGRVPHPETMAPLLHATAYASYGWIDAARRALSRAVRGPAWEAAIEQRLFIETLLDAFEGERAGAIRKADALTELPMPPAGFFARRRVTLLRNGLAALARAFAHSSREGDARLLRKASGASPLVHWAMRYAAAIVAVDGGRPSEVTSLLSGAPDWPAESAFHEYHGELLSRT